MKKFSFEIKMKGMNNSFERVYKGENLQEALSNITAAYGDELEFIKNNGEVIDKTLDDIESALKQLTMKLFIYGIHECENEDLYFSYKNACGNIISAQWSFENDLNDDCGLHLVNVTEDNKLLFFNHNGFKVDLVKDAHLFDCYYDWHRSIQKAYSDLASGEYIQQNKLQCLKITNTFCALDYSEYGDSMTNDSGLEIGHIYAIGQNGENLDVSFANQGEVRVIFDGISYRMPSDFPTELQNAFKKGDDAIRKLEDNGRLDIVENNWWECWSNNNGDVMTCPNEFGSMEEIVGEMLYYMSIN